MKATSTPPGARGPPSAVHLNPFLVIQASKPSFCSCVKRRSGAATPCKMLWLFLVVRKTLGDGFGTYLRNEGKIRTNGSDGQMICSYHAASTSKAVKKRIS